MGRVRLTNMAWIPRSRLSQPAPYEPFRWFGVLGSFDFLPTHRLAKLNRVGCLAAGRPSNRVRVDADGITGRSLSLFLLQQRGA